MVSPHLTLATVLLATVAPAVARSVPENVRKLFNNVKNAQSCKNPLAKGFYSKDGDSGKAVYCGDHVSSSGIVYIKGNGKTLVNMDIDCDGAQNSPASDGRCKESEDTQSITSFQWIIEGYKAGIKDVDAYIHPYVVFGNTGTKPGWAKFDPRQYGIEPLSVMAVVCGDRIVYGIWADENGDDGQYPMVGEASLSLATACYGKNAVHGNKGHDTDDVLYIGFTGKDAVPGAKGAKWNAKNFAEFHDSIRARGDKLIARIKP